MSTKTKIISQSQMERFLKPMGFTRCRPDENDSFEAVLKFENGKTLVKVFVSFKRIADDQYWVLCFYASNNLFSTERIIQTPSDILSSVAFWAMTMGRYDMRNHLESIIENSITSIQDHMSRCNCAADAPLPHINKGN